jgi:hypothetical protein
MKLGLYPALKLADARNKALKLRSTVIDGGDPSEERAAAKLVLRTGETVTELPKDISRRPPKDFMEEGDDPSKQEPLLTKRGSSSAISRPSWETSFSSRFTVRTFRFLCGILSPRTSWRRPVSPGWVRF